MFRLLIFVPFNRLAFYISCSQGGVISSRCLSSRYLVYENRPTHLRVGNWEFGNLKNKNYSSTSFHSFLKKLRPTHPFILLVISNALYFYDFYWVCYFHRSAIINNSICIIYNCKNYFTYYFTFYLLLVILVLRAQCKDCNFILYNT